MHVPRRIVALRVASVGAGPTPVPEPVDTGLAPSSQTVRERKCVTISANITCDRVRLHAPAAAHQVCVWPAPRRGELLAM